MAYHNNFVEEISRILEQKEVFKSQEMKALQKEFSQTSGRSFEQFLLDTGMAPKQKVLEALSEYYKVPWIDVRGIFFDHHFVTMFPQELMKREGFIPYRQEGDILSIIASNPSNEDLPDIIGDYVSYDVAFMVGIYRDIFNAIEEFYDLAPTEVDLDFDRNDKNRSEFENDSIINSYKKNP